MCQKVAIAQALVSRPGLLILDEAWTGLDQAARGTLDAAVAERVADGGLVMFVDHDQARLAGRISERWRLDGDGRVSAVPGDGGHPAADDAVVVVELAGRTGGSSRSSPTGYSSPRGTPRERRRGPPRDR